MQSRIRYLAEPIAFSNGGEVGLSFESNLSGFCTSHRQNVSALRSTSKGLDATDLLKQFAVLHRILEVNKPLQLHSFARIYSNK
jgi:hypothetical protein